MFADDVADLGGPLRRKAGERHDAVVGPGRVNDERRHSEDFLQRSASHVDVLHAD